MSLYVTYTLGHDALSKMSVVGRMVEKCLRFNGRIDKDLLWEKRKTSGVI